MKHFIYFLLPLIYSCSKSGSTVNPMRKDIIETVYASGKIISENEYHVYALSNGVVKEKSVKEGDTVSKNQVLYMISNEAPTARMDAAKSNFDNAQSNASPQSRILNDLQFSLQNAGLKFKNDSLNYFRLKNLQDQNATSKISVDNAYTVYEISLNQKKSAEEKYRAAINDLNVALQNAKSQLANARSDLDNYFIRTESEGTVFQLLKEAGEAVRAGEVVALIGASSKRIIRLAVDQQDIDKIKTGQQVLLKTDVGGNTIFHATVSTIYPVMNEIDQTFRVDAVFSDSTLQRYIHSSVEANIIIREKNHALIIPRNALVTADSVRIKKDGKIKTVFVATGIHTLDDVEIIKGVDESSEIVIPVQK